MIASEKYNPINQPQLYIYIFIFFTFTAFDVSIAWIEYASKFCRQAAFRLHENSR